MSRCTMIGYGLILAGLLVVGVGCPYKPPRIYPPVIDASQAAAKAIEMYDANKDGKLSGAELDKCPGLKAAAASLDPDGRGITADMIVARIKVWQNNKIGRLRIACTVRCNGKPLAGAQVKFVPEEFLGPNMIVATGETDQSGMANVSIPTSGERTDPPGVPQGFYRVEITKPGLNIPAKYNTETVLGHVVAYGGEHMEEPIPFDLQF